MRTIIAGAGVVGTALAQQLSSEGHQVVLIDEDRDVVRAQQERLDALSLVGNASMPSTLKKAGVESADMAIAVTSSDEVNLVVGMVAHRMGVDVTIVRLRSPEYTGQSCVLPPNDLGISQVINPEPAIVNAIVRMIDIPGANDVSALADDQILMLGFDVDADSPLAGRTPAELREAGELNAFLVLYIRRGDDVIVPRGQDRIKTGDNVHLLVAAEMADFVAPMLHRRPIEVKRVVIMGASRVGLSLAKALETRSERVVLIESDKSRAESAADTLSRCTVLNGEPTHIEILEEAAIGADTLVCAVSDDEQLNMMSVLLARKQGALKTALIVNSPEYVPIMQSLGIDAVINPRLATVGQILAHVRRGHIHSVLRLESEAELIEMEADPDSPIVSGPLSTINFPKRALVGALMRDGVMTIPTGATQIQVGDRVIVYTMPDAIPHIEKLFGDRR